MAAPTERKIMKKEASDKTSFKFAPSVAYLQVIGTGARGAPRSLYLFTDNIRYMFNCGEGTQRLANEHKIKISRLEHVFVTYPSWENIGGLPGMVRSIRDSGVKKLLLHGPDGLDELFKATSEFVSLRDLSVDMTPCSVYSSYQDGRISVKYVRLVASSRNEEDSLVDRDKSLSIETSHECEVFDEETMPKDKTGTPSVALAYICSLKPKHGNLSVEACLKYGVRRGSLQSDLKEGKPVVLANGKAVNPRDVTLPTEPASVFIVVECPSKDFLESLVNSDAFKNHQANSKSADYIAYAVIHFTPSHVMEDTRYENWMKKFSKKTKHVYVNDYNECLGSEAVHRIQHQLNLLEPDIFPILKDHSIPQVEKYDGNITIAKKFFNSESVSPISHTLRTIMLQPAFYDLKRPTKVQLLSKCFVNDAMKSRMFENAMAKLKDISNKIILRDYVKGIRPEYPIIVFLGTGASGPSKTRNASAILLTASCNNHILLDCGESTFNQIVRLFGNLDCDHILANLKAVFISHLHANHHLGLIGVLKARRAALSHLWRYDPVKLLVIGPIELLRWLEEYHNKFEHILDDFTFISNEDLTPPNWSAGSKLCEDLSVYLEMMRVVTCPVHHSRNSYGIAFTHRDGWKITYSGDTRPCKNLAQIGKDSDLLIHEATMSDELTDEARTRYHSTTSEAIEAGKMMNAKFTMLTHFSQKCGKMPKIDGTHIFNKENIGVAFDNMVVMLKDLKKLNSLYSPLRIMYAEHCSGINNKLEINCAKRERDKENLKERYQRGNEMKGNGEKHAKYSN